jgi:hypothetical protein
MPEVSALYVTDTRWLEVYFHGECIGIVVRDFDGYTFMPDDGSRVFLSRNTSAEALADAEWHAFTLSH